MQSPFTIGSVTASPGSVAGGSLDVGARAGDSGASIPFTIVHGASPGPVLLLVAGTHGMEYVPVIALQRLRTTIDPRTLRDAKLLASLGREHQRLQQVVALSNRLKRLDEDLSQARELVSIDDPELAA